MAVAEAHLAATFNKPGHDIVDHYTYFICSDGDLMEGISHEAASFAGHFKLGKLIGFYDDNQHHDRRLAPISRSPTTRAKRFEAYGWQVLHIDDVNDLDEIDGAIAEAQSDTERPTLVDHAHAHRLRQPASRTREKAHGEPLGKDEVVATKKNLGWPSTRAVLRARRGARALAQDEGARRAAARRVERASGTRTRRRIRTTPKELERRLAGKLPAGLGERRSRRSRRRTATSRAAPRSARCSTRPPTRSPSWSADRPTSRRRTTRRSRRGRTSRPTTTPARYMHFGIREHGMGVDHERHGAARRRHPVRRHVPDLLGLHAAGDSSRVRSCTST